MKTCVIADASEVIRKVARFHLENAGVKVFDAGDAEVALQLCREQLPDVLFLDWKLPGMTTTSILSALRFSGHKRPTVVYLATENDPQEVSRAFAAGAKAYLLKPFDKGMLMQKAQEVALAS